MARKTKQPASPAPAPSAPPAVVLELAEAPVDCLQVVGLPPATEAGHVLSVAPGDLVDTARRLDDKLSQWAKTHPAAELCYSIAASWVVGEPVAEVVVAFLRPPPSEA
jgi:hypothetical protein